MLQHGCAFLAVVMLSSSAYAKWAHEPRRMKPLATSLSASSALDHVPLAAERIARAYGVVTSTFRTIEHNREVGGVFDSYHLLGRAIDVVRRPGISHAKIAAALRTAGYVLIESLDEGDHSHFAFGPAQRRNPPSEPRQAPTLAHLPLAADEHGSLLSDLSSKANGRPANGPILRVHIRTKR